MSTRHVGDQAAGIESTVVFPMVADPVPSCVEDARAIPKSRQRQENQAKAGLLVQLAARAHGKGLSLFAYLADLVPEDIGTTRFLSLE
jgi:hypothetical protein